MPRILRRRKVWTAFICLLEWGLIHIFAGGITVYYAYKLDVPALLSGICSGAPKAIKEEATTITAWNAMNMRILIQHGLVLFFVGVWSTYLAIALLKDASALHRSFFLMCLWPWFADIAYFYAIDTVNYALLLTESQTVIVSIGTWCVGRLVKEQYGDIGAFQSLLMTALPFLFITSSIVDKIMELGWKKTDYPEL